MEPTVLIAVIAGAVSLVGAAFTFAQANRTARLKSEADLIMEEFKADDSKRRRAFDLATQESEPVTTALGQAWADIQTLRDVINKVVAPAHYDESLALRTLTSSTASLVAGYSQWGPALPAAGKEAWHSAKNAAVMVELLVRERGAGPISSVDSQSDVDDRLRDLRSALAENQNMIQSALLNARAAYMQRILEAM